MSVEFVDTNVLVYAYDPTTAEKHNAANLLVARLWEEVAGALSVQVLQELFWTMTRKVPRPLAPSAAIEVIDDLSAWRVYSPTAQDVVEAARRSSRRRIAFWDSMIVQAAVRSGAAILWSEYLGAGTEYEGVVVRNPFR